MNSRYESEPVGITRVRVKTCPKTRNHSSGWMARVRSSVGSRLSFRRSAAAMAPAWWANLKRGLPSIPSAKTVRGVTCAADVTEAPFVGNRASSERDEHVVERGAGAHPSFQVERRAERRDPAGMHDGE